MTNEKMPEDLKWIRWRYAIVVILFFLMMLLGILISAFHIQFAEGERWSEWKDRQTRDSVLVAPSRGNIFSDDGALMATSVPSYALYMDFRVYEDPSVKNRPDAITAARKMYADTLKCYIKPLSEALSRYFPDKTPEEFRSHIWNGFNKGSREYLLDKRRVSYFELKEIQQLPFFEKGRNRSGLYTKKYIQRAKMFGSLASRTIGDIYAEEGKGGSKGLELAYDSLLRGTPGLCSRQKVAGRYMDVVQVAPVNGCDLHTTINLPIQDIVESALLGELIKTNAISGTAVLMEVKSGRIRAISNLGKDTDGVYRERENYAANDMSEPGSTFKTIAMMAALEEGRVKPDDKVDTEKGRVMLYGQYMTDHNYNHGGYGVITAAQSVWYSSNIGMARLVDKGFKGMKNADVFVNRIYKMGFNKDLHIEIPGAAKPNIPHPKDKARYWSATDLPWMSTGYVVQIPPIYTLSYYNAIANNGCYLRPYFVDRITRDNVVIQKFSPEVITPKICSDRTLKEIRGMLDSVIICGTGRSYIKSDIVPISGKTGTAVLSKGAAGYRAGGKNYQVSFCGYFPSYDPKYTCIVVIRDPEGYASGSTMSGSVFKKIAEQVYSKELQIEVEKMAERDSLVPKVKAGFAPETEYLMDELKIPLSHKMPVSDAVWVQQSSETMMEMDLRDTEPGKVPNVLGMGLRDALYALEQAGLQVHVSGGEGRVVQQSLRAGMDFRRGNEIYIRLNH